MDGENAVKKQLSRNKLLLVLAAVAVLGGITNAQARRTYMSETGYFDANGGIVGSITYPCFGRPVIEGELVGTPRELYRWRCL